MMMKICSLFLVSSLVLVNCDPLPRADPGFLRDFQDIFKADDAINSAETNLSLIHKVAESHGPPTTTEISIETTTLSPVTSDSSKKDSDRSSTSSSTPEKSADLMNIFDSGSSSTEETSRDEPASTTVQAVQSDETAHQERTEAPSSTPTPTTTGSPSTTTVLAASEPEMRDGSSASNQEPAPSSSSEAAVLPEVSSEDSFNLLPVDVDMEKKENQDYPFWPSADQQNDVFDEQVKEFSPITTEATSSTSTEALKTPEQEAKDEPAKDDKPSEAPPKINVAGAGTGSNSAVSCGLSLIAVLVSLCSVYVLRH